MQQSNQVVQTSQANQRAPIPNPRLRVLQRLINPAFLQRIDRRFLITHPGIWSLQLHALIYYSTLAYLSAVLVGSTIPIHTPYKLGTYYPVSIIFMIFVTCCVLGAWFYRHSQFSLEHEHGIQTDPRGIIEYALVTGAIFIVLLAFPIAVFSAAQRLDKSADPNQLATDLVILTLIQRTPDMTWHDDLPHESTISVDDLRVLGNKLPENLTFADLHPLLEGNHYFSLNEYDPYNANASKREFVDWVASAYQVDELNEWRVALQNGSAGPMIEALLIRYNGVTSPQSYYGWAVQENTYHDWVFYSAVSNGHNLYAAGFSKQPLQIIGMLLPILLIVAIDLSLVRFIIKHAGRRATFQIGGFMFGGAILAWLIAGLNRPIMSFFIHRYHATLSWSDPAHDALYYIGPLILFSLFTLWLLRRARRATSQPKYSWGYALPLYALPLLLIALTYAVLMIAQYSSIILGFGNLDLFKLLFYKQVVTLHSHAYYHITLFGILFFWTIHLIYLPLIPYCKRQFTSLLALPRHQ